MIKELSAKLIAATAEINRKSRDAYVAEQRVLAEKAAKKEMKMPGVPVSKADPAAVTNADKMAKTKVVEEADGSTPKTSREKQLAAMSGNKKKISFGDVLKARGVKMKEEVEEFDEGVVGDMAKKAVKVLTGGSDKDQLKNLQKRMGVPQTGEKPMKEGVTNAFDYKNTPSQIPKKPGELTGHDAKKTEKGMMYTKKPVKGNVKENMDTPGNSTHQCAVHVKSEQYGEGRTLTSQHALPDREGNIAWYDVMFAEGIKRVYTEDVEVLVSESHMMHSTKKKKAK